jgi:diguanylate cyclase
MAYASLFREYFSTPIPALPLDAAASPWPSLLGFVLAAAAGYAAFGLLDRAGRARQLQRWLWRLGAATVLAVGICLTGWIGLYSHGLPLSPLPGPGYALLALAAAFGFALLALLLWPGDAGRRWPRQLLASLALALGLLGGHYLSFADPARGLQVGFDLERWLASGLVALVTAVLSLQLAGFARQRRSHAPPPLAPAAALVFAAGVLATHLAALGAARWARVPLSAESQHGGWAEPVLPLLGLGLLLAAVLVRLFERRSDRGLVGYRARLRREQRTDAATGLPTAMVLGESFLRMQRLAVAAHAGVAVAVIKLTGLERVLANHGGDERDQIYSLAAWRLRTVRREDELLGVLGDERFVLVLRVADAGDAASRLRAAIALFEPPLRDEGVQIRVRPQVGISLWPAQGEHYERLLSNALVALERSRPGTVQVYLAAHREESERRGRIEAELAAALADGELNAVFQPVLNSRNGQVAGVEMLARWASPTIGNVAPEHFVLIAESSGMIGQFDRWLLREAVASARWLEAAGFAGLRIAVNISPLNLADPDFATFVEDLFAGGAVDPERIEVEITEAAIAEGDRVVLDTLIRLRGLGLALSIDDFGIGHSSLARLRDLPVDRLKIDRSFVRDMEDVQGEQLVCGIIGLAHGLGLEVTAEGVETELQRQYLSELGCEYLQGYLISKPLTWRGLLDYLGEPDDGLRVELPMAPSSAA